MRIQHNISAMNSYRQLGTNNNALGKNLEKLSSGYRINRAGDDAAGLAISEKMRAQIKGLETAQKNANDAISLVQTAEGALTEVHSMLNRMTELATQSANGTYEDSIDRSNLQAEVTALLDEVDRISKATNFNGINLLDGSMARTAPATKKTDFASATVANGTVTFTPTADQMKAIATDAVNKLGAKATDVVEISFVANGADRVDMVAKVGTKSLTLATSDAITDQDTTAGSKFGFGAYGELEVKATTAGTAIKATDVVTGLTTGATAGQYTVGTVDDKGKEMQIGDTADSFNKIKVRIGDMSSKGLGVDAINIGNQADASKAIKTIKTAINKVSSTRGDLGAVQNRLEHTINNLGVTTENITAAESRIRDTDMASEMMAYTKNNILIQASQAMLAQANQVPQGVLQLLQ